MTTVLYRKYLLLVLTVILTFNYVDRVALGVLLEDIKVSVRATDTQLGLLSGIAFAFFYSIMGVPIARWADRGNRVRIIALTTLMWSIGVAACAAAQSFTQLLTIRVAVAVGEAGCIPPAFALLAEYFSRAERPRSAAIYGLGGGFACVIGYFMAGWLNEVYNWRVTFLVIAVPGPFLAVLSLATLREPRTQRMRNGIPPQVAGSEADKASLFDVCSTLWKNPTFRNLVLCLSVSSFFGYGALQWQASFYIRSYLLTSAQVGAWLALTYGITTLIGTYIGGEIATRYAPHNETRQLRGMAVVLAASGLLSFFTYLTNNLYISFACLALTTAAQGVLNGPLFSTIQTLIPEDMRAVAFSILYLISNLIGMGFGPLSVGFISDELHTWAGNDSLRYALTALAPGYFWVGWHSWLASKTVADDIIPEQNMTTT